MCCTVVNMTNSYKEGVCDHRCMQFLDQPNKYQLLKEGHAP